MKVQGREDWLIVEMWSSATAASLFPTLMIHATYRTPSGDIVIVENTMQPNIAFPRRPIRQRFDVLTGDLLGVTVQTLDPGFQVAELFVQVSLTRARPILPVANDVVRRPYRVLVRGYVYEGHWLSWPDGTLEGMLEGRGKLRLLDLGAMAAGSEIEIQVPEGCRWRVLCFSFILTTSATVANRDVVAKIFNGANGFVFSRSGVGLTETASSAWKYNFAPSFGGAFPRLANIVVGPIPEIELSGTMGIGTETSGLQVGDQFSATRLAVEEWMDYQVAL